MFRNAEHLLIAKYRFVCELRHPSGDVRRVEIYRKANRVALVEYKIYDNRTNQNIIVFSSVRSAIKHIRDSYGFAFAKKAEYMMKEVSHEARQNI